MTATARPRSEWNAAAHPGPAAVQGNLAAALQQADPAPGPAGSWRRGWALVALGRFGEGWSSLAACGHPDTPYGAAAAVTRASLLRQIGLHDGAEEWDRAVAAQAPAGSEVAAAAAIGLVADGVGAAVGSAELEQRLAAAGSAVAAIASPRQRVRMAWVAGEVAMVAGDYGLAEGRFTAAAEAARGMRAQRHRAKSLAFAAAALGAMGESGDATRTAESALRLAEQLDAAPVRWAAHLVLADLVDTPTHHAAAAQLFAAALEGLPADIGRTARERMPARVLLED